MFQKVLILSASAGAGHVRAAQAIERAMVELNAAREVRHIDTLEYTNKLFHRLYSQGYIEMVNKAPEVMGWLYDHLDKPWKNEKRRLAFDKLNAGKFIRLLEQYQPDFTICTHFLPSEIISWLKSKERLSTRQAIVVTDLDVHALWLCRHFEHYFVALDETRVHLEKLGVPVEKITVSGIPIDPVFSQTKDKGEMRRKYGLREDRTTILISAGGFGVGPIENLVKSLLETKHPLQVIAISGRSEELKSRLENLARETAGHFSAVLKVVGYTTDMDEYMSASDVLVGKPGGLTTSEALAKGLVLVIVNPIPGQEERNSDHLLEEGAAIRCNNLPCLAYKIDKLLDDPARFQAMQVNVRRLARPHAARDIVAKLVEIERT
jgi:processive 1,2-diacylglycerol beta-glucosyltransferase